MASGVQLSLLQQDDDPDPWRLDERTREIGRRGVALCREVLAAARKDLGPTDRRDAAA